MVYRLNVLIVGLTGGIGSGKTLVATVLQELGIDVVNADDVAREVVLPGTPALQKIEEYFGADFIKNKALDRVKLRERIFRDSAAKNWLESLLHPIIRVEMLTQLKNCTSAYKILEAPLLFENGLDSYCEKSITVDVPEAMQIQRATQRDHSSSDTIKAIINAQWSREQRLAKSDYIIDNSGDPQATRLQVMRLDKILNLLVTTKA